MANISKRNYMVGVNPEILRWARQKAGYSLEDVARAFGKKPEEIEMWEKGEEFPTYTQLDKIAYVLYKRPLALFFFPEPPDESDPKQSFRTLPDFEIDNLSQDTRYAIRKAQAMQIALSELNGGINPSQQKIFRDIHIREKDDPRIVAKILRQYLGISLEDQFGWKNRENALGNWRNIVQDKGVFIFKRAYKQKDISGLCLVDQEFPIIYLNNGTAPSRQIFTIFHELTHVLLNSNGITKSNINYISYLVGDAKNIEMFCNQLAAEFLVPSEDFDRRIDTFDDVEKLIDVLAAKYKVSREVILRKLLDRKLVSQSYYDEKSKEWNEQFQEMIQKRKEKKGGGDYYATQAVYLGDKYLSLAFSKYYQGHLNRDQLADYLNVKVKNVSALETTFLARA